MGLMVCEDIVAVVFLMTPAFNYLSKHFELSVYCHRTNRFSPWVLLAAIEALLGGIGLILLGFAVARYVAPLSQKNYLKALMMKSLKKSRSSLLLGWAFCLQS